MHPFALGNSTRKMFELLASISYINFNIYIYLELLLRPFLSAVQVSLLEAGSFVQNANQTVRDQEVSGASQNDTATK